MKRFFVVFLCLSLLLLACKNSKVKNAGKQLIGGTFATKGINIAYPQNNTLFPFDFQAPTFVWVDSVTNNSGWNACIADSAGNIVLADIVDKTSWKPDSDEWENLKKKYVSSRLQFAVVGFNKYNEELTGNRLNFAISKDPVGAEIFFRAVTLPFSYAVRNVQTIEWYLGNVSGGAPRKMLDNMPVCANCHSFSKDGPTLAMDVDYGNDKGSYAIENAMDTCFLKPESIISWSNFKKEENDPTFGLLSQISPSGNYVLSTVKDLSVFVAVDDNLAYSQLFFPIKGIIGIYDRNNKTFSELQGANDPNYVQSNPVWSPDSRKVLFARTYSYISERIRKSGRALLYPKDVEEFTKNHKSFKFNIYSLDFNEGKGSSAMPLQGASDNGKSNYFPKFSPDGKWIVFCQSDNYMLLQPDSKLYIVEANGGKPRLMNCNMSNMNSWHSWSPNGKWLVFSSKSQSLYTRLYLTHIDEQGNDSPPILLENLVFEKRAANIPEFFPGHGADFKKIKDSFSNTAPYFTQLSLDNIASEYYVRALKNLEKASALDSNYLDAYIQRILVNAILQQVNSKSDKADKDKALVIVNNLIKKNGEDKELLLLKATLLSANADLKEAEELLQKIIAMDAKYYKAYELLANVFKKSNRFNETILTYNKMKGLVPANEYQINLKLAKVYMEGHQYQNALTLLNNMAKRYPDFDEIQVNLCNLYIEMQKGKEAKKEMNILWKKDSTNFRYLFMRARVAVLLGDNVASQYLNEGIGSLHSKYGLNKENVPLAFEMASMLTQFKKYNEAIDLYNGVLTQLPYNYMALKEKARMMLIMQNWQGAIELYQSLLEYYSPEEEFYNNVAVAYINMGNLQDALVQFNNSLRLNPSNIDALFNRAKLYKMMGEQQKANVDINKMKQALKSKKNLTENEKQLLEN